MVLNIALDEMSRQKLTLFLCFFGSNAGRGLPMWLSGKESICQCTGLRFDPWVGKIPWRRKWQHITLFLPGEFHGQKSLAGYSPWGHTESDMTEATAKHSDKCYKENETFEKYSSVNQRFSLIRKK